jgi:Wadjet anti plasmid transformation system JetA-like protein
MVLHHTAHVTLLAVNRQLPTEMPENVLTVPPPPWLAEEPEITAMLHAVVNRFDQQRGADRSRDVSFDTRRLLPTLGRGGDAADQLWSLVKSLAHLGVLKIRSGKRSSFDDEWVNAKLAFPNSSEETLRSWLDREPKARAIDQWREAVGERAHLFSSGIDLLSLSRIDIPGRTAAEIVQALASIESMSSPISLRQLSARIFWGDSKLLDQRADLIAALFPKLEIRERPIIASIYLPDQYAGVLFIENQDSYAVAMKSSSEELRRLALIYASGFRSSAERIRSRDGVILHFTGSAQPSAVTAFEHWWFKERDLAWPAWFWGDLDFSGMQILKTLRARFEGIGAWARGYDPMVQLSREGHASPTQGRGQIDPVNTGDGYADSMLLPAIREFGFIDQEAIPSL